MNNSILGKDELALYDYVRLKNAILIIFKLFKYLKLSDDRIIIPKITSDKKVRYDEFIKVDTTIIDDFNLKSLLLKVKNPYEKNELFSKITLALRKLNDLELVVFDLTFYKCTREEDIINAINYGKDKVREIKKSAAVKFLSVLGLDYIGFK